MSKGKVAFISFLVITIIIGLTTAIVFERETVKSLKHRSWFKETFVGITTYLKPVRNITRKSICEDFLDPQCDYRIKFLKVNKDGEMDENGRNYVIIFDPKSSGLDFKVNLGLDNELYEKNNQGNLVKNYVAKTFQDIISDQNSTLNGEKPIAAINGDYIDELNRPQGLNFSRGENYSGDFASVRSSFAISGGDFEHRKASVGTGLRSDPNDHFNAVGGNGRFYTDGVFEDICEKLGSYACNESTNRSMAAVTEKGWVIFLVHQSLNENKLYPNKFNVILEKLSSDYNIGKIQDAILFDGGKSPGLMYESTIYVQNPGPIGSVFLIYMVK